MYIYTKNMGKFNIFKVSLFIMIHLSFILILFVPFKIEYLIVAFFSYFIRMFGVTGVYHRYFSHRAYKTSRFFQFILAWIGAMAMQKGPLWWSSHHRDHHKYSDEENDLHSPRKGFWNSHMIWFLNENYSHVNTQNIKDLLKFPELVWLDKFHWIPPLSFAILLYLIGGFAWLAYGFGLATFLLGHGTWTINSLSHLLGKKRFETGDDSKNNWVLAIITMGEGWHNNHHYYRHSANQGFFWYEIDITYYILNMFKWAGLIWELKKPTEQVMELAYQLDQNKKIVKLKLKEST